MFAAYHDGSPTRAALNDMQLADRQHVPISVTTCPRGNNHISNSHVSVHLSTHALIPQAFNRPLFSAHKMQKSVPAPTTWKAAAALAVAVCIAGERLAVSGEGRQVGRVGDALAAVCHDKEHSGTETKCSGKGVYLRRRAAG
eukprot:1145347-Pelagomonas_calceolata.AAC.1